ncbi:MAG: PAS domain S-box protein [Bacteroidales bacterium]|nr:PAS domain S-box protein [Bacteroidales bacterium]
MRYAWKNRSVWIKISVVSVIAVMVIAVTGLAGYLPGFTAPGSVKEGYIPMAPATSIGFIIYGVVILVLLIRREDNDPVWLPAFLSGVVMLFGILEVAGFLTGLDLSLEDRLVPEMGHLGGIPVARMSPATGAVLAVTGLIMYLKIFDNRLRRFCRSIELLSGILILMVMIYGVLFSLAYLYRRPLLYEAGEVIPMAETTTWGVVLMSVSLLALRERLYPMKLLTENTTRGYLLRFILPLAILAVLSGGVTAFLSLQIFKINPAFISAFLLIIVIIIAGISATVMARYLGGLIDMHRSKTTRTEKDLIISEEQYRTLFETMAEGVVYQDSGGEIISANRAASEILGLTIEQMKGKSSIDPEWRAVDREGNELPGEMHAAMMALRTGKIVDNFIQGIFNPQKKDYVWIIVNSIPQFRKGSDKPFRVFSTFLEITRRKKAEDELQILKSNLEKEVATKTRELNERIRELEHFHEVTIERELRMEELRKEIELLRNQPPE